MQKALYWIGILCAAAAAILGTVGSEIRDPGANPLGAIALAIAALAFIQASRHSPAA